ncbi:hypothetical protein [Peptostreptococcus canis]|uniref:ATPase n=1 Tax=Peptostreptococcus canis TaxID=1159213 RepID=A0ABR6TJD5_9FIRM|nr:hypothetical protein [Peptostreptococcus canis]MBC2575253.1 hypothetical protein [Peptostreptococcus canis]MBP1997565.1 hypothetical protein [Peptostreptococcus canis]
MKATYVDIHIHTSENPNDLASDYDVSELLCNVRKIAGDNPILLSLTDHNTINKLAYMNLLKEDVSVVLGVELHIKKYSDAPPYHCHIIFNTEITEEIIDNINEKLDKLYPDKVVTDEDENTPNIEMIINAFDSHDFLLLPHGGQSHRTFDKATSKKTKFDTSMEQSIYHNHFDGFTSRSSTGIENTKAYFKRIGIHEFVNLITCTDNYNPKIYPKTKAKNAEEFTPTWMLAEASFDGLRLSLSEESRLYYSTEPPQKWTQTFGRIELCNEKIEIDVNMTPGLNVVIGGSSSGKTLFVDSLVRGTKRDFQESKYNYFNVEDIVIENPTGVSPYYISQNFIMSIIKDSGSDLGEIPVIDKVFPEDKETLESIRNSLKRLKELINTLLDSARKFEKLKDDFSHIKTPNFLITNEIIKENVIEKIKPSEDEKERVSISITTVEEYKTMLENMKMVFKNHPIIGSKDDEVNALNQALDDLLLISKINSVMVDEINKSLVQVNKKCIENNRKNTQIKSDRDILLKYIYDSIKALKDFYFAKSELSKFDVAFETKEIKVGGHTLSIKNSFKLTENELVASINKCLTNENRLACFDEINPSTFEKNKFSQRPKISSHSDLANKVYKDIENTDKKEYQIITKDGRDYKSLSPGWKSAVILDLILGYEENFAPIIIDQPEDNLATNYINRDLIEMIKNIKEDKQVILVSHNATIPMLGDAQNVIICENDGERLYINSAILESGVKGKKTLDWIAELTDGGKPSIKKRVKKYNFRSYKGV